MSVILRRASVMILVFASPLLSTAQRSRTSGAMLSCANVTITGLPDLSTLRIGGATVRSYNDRSMSSVTIQNVSDRSIENLLVLVEFVDAHGNRLETGLYYATTHRFSDELLEVQKGYGIQKLQHPLKPREVMDLSTVSDVVLPGCPANGIVTKADVRFNDGSELSRSSSKWLTDPVFREATVDMDSFPASAPSEFYATVDLNNRGQATIIETDELESQVRTWWQKQVNGWSIVPGDRGPLAQEIQRFTMLVRINGRDLARKRMLESQNIVSPLIVVDIAPLGSFRAKQPVTIGGMLASSRAATSAL